MAFDLGSAVGGFAGGAAPLIVTGKQSKMK